MMDDITMLSEARRGLAEPPRDAARAAARAALLERAATARREARDAPRRRAGVRLWTAGIGVTAAAAAVAVGFVLLAPVDGGHRTASATPTANPQNLRTAMLAAFESYSGSILYARITQTLNGKAAPSSESWAYPVDPKPGQHVRNRNFSWTADGRPNQDVSFSYVPGKRGEVKDVEYSNRTWSDQKNVLIRLYPDHLPTGFRQQIAAGRFTVLGKVRLDGHTTIEVQWHPAPGQTTWCWVDATTYQLVKVANDSIAGPLPVHIETDYKVLPATSANMALLDPKIPAGFRKTAQQDRPAG